MRERIRILAAACFYYVGLVHLILWWKQRTGKRLTILNYHRATGPHIQHQLRLLRRHYRILPLEEALEEFYGGYSADPVVGLEKRDQRALLVLTFDDGYLDNYLYAWKLACQLCIPITIFLIPGYVESGAYFWWLADDYLAVHTSAETVTANGKTFCLEKDTERKALAQFIDQRTRYVTSVAEREQFLCSIQERLGTPLPSRQQCGLSDMSLPLNWDEIHEMARSGWVSFGAHTMHHPVLAYLSDTEELQYEVSQCREILQQQLGKPIRCFCYPVGHTEHIGVHTVEAVKQAGYDWALTTSEDVNTPQTDPYLLARLPGDETQHWLVMAAELAGLLGIMSRLRKKYGKNLKKRPGSGEGRTAPQLPPYGAGSSGATSSPSL
ncbi:MAG TPA: polysaccharide deacetylase family protein [Ktedonobacteraceae bacterium]